MRKINDIIPPSSRRETKNLTSEPVHRRSPSTFPYKTIIAVIIVVIASFGALTYFSTAKVEVTPNTVSAAIQSSFTASQSAGDLPYQVITAQKIASQSVKSSGTKTVNSSASGTITVYNTQAKAQRLITNTRFATTAGLIFRIHEAIVIPAGSTTNPGSTQVKVYADKTGDIYNISPTSFTIPGFAGTPLATKVYARSFEAFFGGVSGIVPVVDTSTETQAQLALTKALTTDLAASMQSQIPDGYLLLPGAATTTFQELTPTPSATAGMVDVKEQGTITAVVFPNSALAKAIASSVAKLGYQGESLTLLPTSTLELSASSMPDAEASSFAFSINGTASLSYTVDPTRIAAAIAGKSRTDAQVALTNYPEVKSAVIILRPFWRQTFPDDPASISVTVATP